MYIVKNALMFLSTFWSCLFLLVKNLESVGRTRAGPEDSIIRHELNGACDSIDVAVWGAQQKQFEPFESLEIGPREDG